MRPLGETGYNNYMKTTQKLYHKDIYMPAEIDRALTNAANRGATIELKYSGHAINASKNDRYGKINLPKTLNTAEATFVEVELTGRAITKVVYRVRHDSRNDLVIVVMIQTGLVKTVWLNSRTDKHSSLKTWKYATN